MNTITVATFNELEKAELVRQRLVQAGLHPRIHDESKLQRFWFMSKPSAAEKVEVPKGEFEMAERLLHDWDKAEDLLQDAVRCPQCGSSRIEYPQFTRKFLLPTLAEAFVFLKIVPREYYCEDCHFTWPDHEEPEPEVDLLGWPLKPGRRATPPDTSRRQDAQAG
jgi:hypothetical protein